jgi:hypothetical protein
MEALFRASSRCHLARFDRRAPTRCQNRILLGLLHQARATRFGRDHDFRRIRTVADFRRLVPLCTRADLWRQYWQPVYPHLGGATWPASGPDTKTNGEAGSLSPSRLVSVSDLQAAHRQALRTALALVAHARPRARLLSGGLLFAEGEGPSNVTKRGSLPKTLPTLVRPYARTGADAPAERWAQLPVTCLAGSVEGLLPLLESIKQVRGKRCVRDVWPGLTAILYTRRSVEAPVDQLRAEADGVLLLETTMRADGPIAVEDPRHGLLRLLYDHGVYFEFVPPDQADEPRCPRYGIGEVETGVPYELVVTSPAGLWACRTGRTVCLERLDPPLLRFLDTIVPQPPLASEERLPGWADLIRPTLPAEAFHLQNGDSPAVPPGSSFHSPWSILADLG